MRTYSIRITAGEALFLWRLRNDIRIVDMAPKVGYTRETFSDMERGKVDPAPEYRQRIEEQTNGTVPTTAWACKVDTALEPHEYLILMIQRKGLRIVDFCGKTGMRADRTSGIIRGFTKPSPAEQEKIGAWCRRLKNAWRDA